jgi:hypothetical protein
MKAVVLACLEPQHLDLCLDALTRWLPAEDVLVINNGNVPERTEAIERIARRWNVPTGRNHDLTQGEDTIPYAHEAFKEVSKLWPGETILKLDEDVLLVSRPELWDVGPMELMVPAVTVNNYTSRFFLEKLDPELAAQAVGHPWLWHRPHPVTGEDTRLRAMKALYSAEPAALLEQCRAEGEVRRLGRDDWEREGLMDVSETDERRGISCTVMAFRSDDYLTMMGEGRGVDEVLFAEAVHSGRATYVVDTRIFCHHVNYYSLRAEVRDLGESIESWNRRAVVAATHAALGLGAHPAVAAPAAALAA